MSKHDILCNVYENACCPWMGNCECQCTCDIIAIIREDERGKRESDGPWFRSVVHECCERVQTERAAALRDAVEAVKAQTVALWSHPRDGTERTALWLDDAITAIEALGGER